MNGAFGIPLGDPVFHIGRGGHPGAMCTTEEASLYLDSVTDHFALAMLTNRGHCLNGTFEAVECMARTGGFNNESLIVFVAADLAICHKVPPWVSSERTFSCAMPPYGVVWRYPLRFSIPFPAYP